MLKQTNKTPPFWTGEQIGYWQAVLYESIFQSGSRKLWNGFGLYLKAVVWQTALLVAVLASAVCTHLRATLSVVTPNCSGVQVLNQISEILHGTGEPEKCLFVIWIHALIQFRTQHQNQLYWSTACWEQGKAMYRGVWVSLSWQCHNKKMLMYTFGLLIAKKNGIWFT